MAKPEPFRLKCTTIPYRKGFIEVSSIHDGCVNLETWDVDASKDLESCHWVDDESIEDSDVNAYCEIELTLAEAEALGKALLAAVERAK